MAESETAPRQQPCAPQAVADSTGDTVFAVQPGEWMTLAPNLSPEAAAMVAPPIIVSGAPVNGRADRHRIDVVARRGNMAPFSRHRRPGRAR